MTYKQLGLVSPERTAEEIMNVVIASRGRFALLGHIKSGWPADLALKDVQLQPEGSPPKYGASVKAKAGGPSTRRKSSSRP